MRLNLKKTQQREIIRVLMHCCIKEKNFNQFYSLLAQRLIKYDEQNYKYTLKYALWDHIKPDGLEKLNVRQLSNLSEFVSFLIASGDVPIHFLKVIEFKPSKGSMSKPATLFMHLMLEHLL